MEIYVCVGSSCHLKGSYNIIDAFQKNINEYELSDKVSLKAAFCLGKCNSKGVTIKIDDEIIEDVTLNNFSIIFKAYVLSTLR